MQSLEQQYAAEVLKVNADEYLLAEQWNAGLVVSKEVQSLQVSAQSKHTFTYDSKTVQATSHAVAYVAYVFHGNKLGCFTA